MKRLLRVGFGLFGLFLGWVFVADEPFAMPANPEKGKKDAAVATSRSPAPVAAQIDKIINGRLAEEKIPASPLADDAEFIRRASLDIRGRVPTMERTVAFLNDKDPDKRAKLIDEFLADSEYGEHFAIIWYHRIVKPDDDNRLLIAGNKLQDWLEDSFNQNHGWNKIAYEFLSASGDRDENPPTTFFLANVNANKNQYEPAPNKLTTASSRLFFGVKLECCECHNHPYNTMKQTDYWGVAAFFSNTHADHSSKKDAKAGITATVHEGKPSMPGGGKKAKDVTTSHAAFGSIEIPDSKGKTVRAKFLNAETPSVNAGQPLRPVLAKWLTSEQNPFFARALVNKLWANFFGRGIINPVDDMSDEDKATHPEILKLLSEEFVASGFDLKHLIRCICLSETYQRSSQALPSNKEDDKWYSHMKPKVMSADMLFDSLAVVLGHGMAGEEARGKGQGQKKKLGGGPRAAFRKFFHAEADDDVGVVEEYMHGIPQALKLLNGPAISNTSEVVARIRKSADSQQKVIEGTYVTVLSRLPSEAEMQKLKEYAAKESNANKAYNDIAWALINSAEFVFNH
ncbi:MAG TPA: DUF1549 and DUF1553 domain-containing protein [Gemmataceae bacterium]|jgi:hypothetical protein|nr:DUF1549 and DUF1553 domain-containing protein [Gemmataceae bacterium]